MKFKKKFKYQSPNGDSVVVNDDLIMVTFNNKVHARHIESENKATVNVDSEKQEVSITFFPSCEKIILPPDVDMLRDLVNSL